ncbi:TetR/AcrR family transcriptional regulator [Actinomadura madurae]|uniref:TetR/AcrR family transcriptional regulator n=3 Tax=Actinomadura madurae TaxID=1993 RepID=UPI0020275643|nr:TetR/AcrR family transcriptional regulator [Actinomadura madurae]MCP9967912.1 TetR/AcrR family transcriptional regulator [Actinomadura madurae]MCQ0016576.1 TetR/AcrR family transcriptional regulator [Actinomadura madurae]URM96664.1 TetR/AcrR family transcriptional regulator [Actinomadura madurae]URN07347.1 TetR/AcrR family transcriptional regulator [Actinomadura madurae]
MNALWDLRDEPEKKPRMPLSVSAIVDTAIAIADTDGIDAVSMQRIAGDLGFTKMSLYRHVAGKSELLSLMIDTAAGEPPDLDGVSGGWRAKMEEFARQLAEVWRRHPWLPNVTVGTRVMGPCETGWTETAVAALAGTGLTGDERLAAAFLLFGHVRNTQSVTTAGTQAWSGGSEMAELIRSHADLFPELSDALSGPTPCLDDNARAFGLDRLLDGLAVLIEQRS